MVLVQHQLWPVGVVAVASSSSGTYRSRVIYAHGIIKDTGYVHAIKKNFSYLYAMHSKFDYACAIPSIL
jgi:hypothetical protein